MSLTKAERIKRFVAENLDDRFIVVQDGPDYVLAHGDILADGETEDQTIYIMTHTAMPSNGGRPLKEIRDTTNHNLSEGVHTAHVFYKDGINFFRSIRGRETRAKSTFRKYPYKSVREMIKFSPLEQMVFESQKGRWILPRRLSYYQPENRRNEEQIQLFEFAPVEADYTEHPENVQYHTGPERKLLATMYPRLVRTQRGDILISIADLVEKPSLRDIAYLG